MRRLGSVVASSDWRAFRRSNRCFCRRDCVTRSIELERSDNSCDTELGNQFHQSANTGGFQVNRSSPRRASRPNRFRLGGFPRGSAPHQTHGPENRSSPQRRLLSESPAGCLAEEVSSQRDPGTTLRPVPFWSPMPQSSKQVPAPFAVLHGACREYEIEKKRTKVS